MFDHCSTQRSWTHVERGGEQKLFVLLLRFGLSGRRRRRRGSQWRRTAFRLTFFFNERTNNKQPTRTSGSGIRV